MAKSPPKAKAPTARPAAPARTSVPDTKQKIKALVERHKLRRGGVQRALKRTRTATR